MALKIVCFATLWPCYIHACKRKVIVDRYKLTGTKRYKRNIFLANSHLRLPAVTEELMQHDIVFSANFHSKFVFSG